MKPWRRLVLAAVDHLLLVHLTYKHSPSAALSSVFLWRKSCSVFFKPMLICRMSGNSVLRFLLACGSIKVCNTCHPVLWNYAFFTLGGVFIESVFWGLRYRIVKKKCFFPQSSEPFVQDGRVIMSTSLKACRIICTEWRWYRRSSPKLKISTQTSNYWCFSVLFRAWCSYAALFWGGSPKTENNSGWLQLVHGKHDKKLGFVFDLKVLLICE